MKLEVTQGTNLEPWCEQTHFREHILTLEAEIDFQLAETVVNK